MNPQLYELSQKLDRLATREDLQAAIARLEEDYEIFAEHDREVVDRFIADLFRRLEEMD